MMQRVIYKGEVKGSYNLLPFSNLMERFDGKPVLEAYQSLINGKKSCAWILPEQNVVSIDYLPLGRNNYRTIVAVMGKEEERVRCLEKRIREAIVRLDVSLLRSKGRTA